LRRFRVTASSRACVSFFRCPLVVGRDTRASSASSLLVSACPPINAASIVARAVWPTNAAISTMLAAATMRHVTVTAIYEASSGNSAATEPLPVLAALGSRYRLGDVP